MTDDSFNDILHLPHHVSLRHRPMPMWQRATQFAPFAALTGYDEALAETARLTDVEWQNDESTLSQLNRTLSIIMNQLSSHPVVQIQYFVPDKRKTGGSIRSLQAQLKAVDTIQRQLIFANNTIISMDNIKSIAVVEE